MIYMEKLFENTTTYSPNVYAEFVKFHNEKYNLKYHSYTLFVLALIVFCMVSQFMYGNIEVRNFVCTFYGHFFVLESISSILFCKERSK